MENYATTMGKTVVKNTIRGCGFLFFSLDIIYSVRYNKKCNENFKGAL